MWGLRGVGAVVCWAGLPPVTLVPSPPTDNPPVHAARLGASVNFPPPPRRGLYFATRRHRHKRRTASDRQEDNRRWLSRPEVMQHSNHQRQPARVLILLGNTPSLSPAQQAHNRSCQRLNAGIVLHLKPSFWWSTGALDCGTPERSIRERASHGLGQLNLSTPNGQNENVSSLRTCIAQRKECQGALNHVPQSKTRQPSHEAHVNLVTQPPLTNVGGQGHNLGTPRTTSTSALPSNLHCT